MSYLEIEIILTAAGAPLKKGKKKKNLGKFLMLLERQRERDSFRRLAHPKGIRFWGLVLESQCIQTLLLLSFTRGCLLPEQGGCYIFEEVMDKNFPKLMTDMQPHTQEVQSIPSKINNKQMHGGTHHSQTTENKTSTKS